MRKNDLKKQTKRRKQKLQQKRKQLKCTLKSTQHLDKNIILAFTHYKKNTHTLRHKHTPAFKLKFYYPNYTKSNDKPKYNTKL